MSGEVFVCKNGLKGPRKVSFLLGIVRRGRGQSSSCFMVMNDNARCVEIGL